MVSAVIALLMLWLLCCVSLRLAAHVVHLVLLIAVASIGEYVQMIVAGLGGETPHMLSATLLALSRVVYEFKRTYWFGEKKYGDC